MNTLWMILVLVVSGNPAIYAVTGGENVLLPVVAVGLGAVAVSRNARIFEPRVLAVTGALVVIQLVQCYMFGFWPWLTIAGAVTRIFIAAALVAIVRDFPATYLRAIELVAAYCLVMWTIDQTAMALGLDFRGLFSPLEHWVGIDGEHHFDLVYTFAQLEHTYRNCGVFREPGLFAGYLLLGLLFLMIDRSGVAPNVRRRRIIILLATLLTTFSTAGYVTIPLVLAPVAFDHGTAIRRRVAARKDVLAGVLVVSLAGLWLVSRNTTFLEDKIELQYEEFVDEAKNFEITRFGAFMLDMQAISERPVFGWGVNEKTKYALTPDLVEFSPSGGTTGWLRSYGIAGLSVLLLAMFASFRPLLGGSKAAAAYVVAAVVVVAQPNTFLNYPLILCLMFLRRPLEHRDEVVASPEPIADPREHVIEPTPVQNA